MSPKSEEPRKKPAPDLRKDNPVEHIRQRANEGKGVVLGKGSTLRVALYIAALNRRIELQDALLDEYAEMMMDEDDSEGEEE